MTEEKAYDPITWSEDNLVMFLDGYGWTAVVLDGHVENICLGREESVKAILIGKKPVSEAGSLRRERAMLRIMEIKGVQNARAAAIGGLRLQRGRSFRTSGNRSKNLGYAQKRARFSLR